MLSVIVPTYNDAPRLRLCLDALAQQTLPRDRFEVIVVDNGSREPPRELVESYAFCRFAEESSPGSYAARNLALNLARGDLLAFTDSDCLPTPTWLEEGLAAVEQHPDAAIIGGKIEVFAEDANRPTAVELLDIAFGLDQETNIHKTGFSATANLFTRPEVIRQAGSFDAELLSGGDHEWCERVIAGGGVMRYAPAAVVRHPARKSLSGIIKQHRRHVGGRVDRRKSKGQDSVRGYRPWTLHFWWTVGRLVIPNVSRMLETRRRLAARGFGLTAWLRTIPVILAVQYSKALEYGRKLVGLSSERN